MAAAPRYLTTAELAERYRTGESTIRHWRTVDYGPAGIKVGRKVLYDLAVVEAWDAAQRADSADELAAHAARQPGRRRGIA